MTESPASRLSSVAGRSSLNPPGAESPASRRSPAASIAGSGSALSLGALSRSGSDVGARLSGLLPGLRILRRSPSERAYSQLGESVGSQLSEVSQAAKSLAATRIAAIWRAHMAVRRMQLALIETYKPSSFHTKKGEPTDYGSVLFEQHGAREPAKYIRLSDDSDVDRVVGLIRTVWDVPDAQVVISLTGGAQELKLKPHVLDVFNRGLVRAAQQTNAWIITGGTDTGVMKLVGEAVRDYQADVPCIGVSTWGVVNGREQLSGNRGTEEFYLKTKPAGPEGASLEPNHTHFLLVDSGKEKSNAWGGEINFRTRFEQTYCRRNKVPMVLVVVAGGPGTLHSIENAAQNHVPIVLITDSGGAPAIIAHFLKTDRFDPDPTGERGFKPTSNKHDLLKWQDSVRRIKALHVKFKVLTSFETRQGETRNFDLVLLKAILFDTDGNLRQTDLHESKKTLHLAILWGRQEIVSQWIEKSTAMFAVPVPSAPSSPTPLHSPVGSDNGAGEVRGRGFGTSAMRARAKERAATQRMRLSDELQEALQEALHIALRHRKAECVDLLLKSNMRAADVDLLQLYDETLDQLGIFAADLGGLRKGLSAHMALLEEEGFAKLNPRRTQAKPAAGGTSLWSTAAIRGRLDAVRVAVLGAASSSSPPPILPLIPRASRADSSRTSTSRRGSFGDLAAEGANAPFGSDLANLRRQHEKYAQLVVPFLSRACAVEAVEDMWTSGLVSQWGADDVFYWAVLMSDEALVHVLWRHVDEPIRMALVASQMTSQLAEIARFDSVRFANLAMQYEQWALGVLSQCSDELEARWLLQLKFNQSVPGRTDSTLITLAIRTHRKAFMAHAHVQSLLDAWWRGDIVQAYNSETGASSYCLSSAEPNAVVIIAHALTLGLLPLVKMEQTLACKHQHLTQQARHAENTQRNSLARFQRARPRELTSIFQQMQYSHDLPPSHWQVRRDFFAAPKVKFWLRACSYLLFLLLYALVLIDDDGTPDVSWVESAFFVWVLGLAVDELHQFVTNRRMRRHHFDDVWNALDALMFAVLFPLIFTMRVIAYATCCPQPWRSLDTDAAGQLLHQHCECPLQVNSRVMLAGNAIFCFFRFLANYKVHPRLGVLIHVITRIQNDVGMFIAILLFVVLGFAFAFSGLSPPRHLHMHSDATSPFLIPVWNLFDLSDVSIVTQNSEAPALGMALLALYLFISQILLVNLLIAMMNTSYAEAHKNAEQEWAASRASSIEELLILSPVPPPLSMPFLLWDIARGACRRQRRDDAGAPGSAADLHFARARREPSVHDEGSVRGSGRRRNVKLLHEYLEEREREQQAAVEVRVVHLRDEVDKLTSLLETASSDRADVSAKLDKLCAEQALVAAALARSRPLPPAPVVASAHEVDAGFSALTLAVPDTRSRCHSAPNATSSAASPPQPRPASAEPGSRPGPLALPPSPTSMLARPLTPPPSPGATARLAQNPAAQPESTPPPPPPPPPTAATSARAAAAQQAHRPPPPEQPPEHRKPPPAPSNGAAAAPAMSAVQAARAAAEETPLEARAVAQQRERTPPAAAALSLAAAGEAPALSRGAPRSTRQASLTGEVRSPTSPFEAAEAHEAAARESALGAALRERMARLQSDAPEAAGLSHAALTQSLAPPEGVDFLGSGASGSSAYTPPGFVKRVADQRTIRGESIRARVAAAAANGARIALGRAPSGDVPGGSAAAGDEIDRRAMR